MNMFSITQSREDILALEVTFHPFAERPYTVRFHIVKWESDSYINAYYYDIGAGEVKIKFLDSDWFDNIEPQDVKILTTTGIKTVEEIEGV